MNKFEGTKWWLIWLFFLFVFLIYEAIEEEKHKPPIKRCKLNNEYFFCIDNNTTLKSFKFIESEQK